MVDGNIILSVSKAMELLQILSRAGKPLLLKEVSALCGYPKSTVFGLLTTMRMDDVVTQTPDGRYALGVRLFEYGQQVKRSWDISQAARPYMDHLCQQTGASVVLSFCEGGSVITLDQAEMRNGLRVVSEIGSRLPIYCTSPGKVFLAHMPRTGAETVLRSQSMTPFTPHTVTDIPTLMQEIDRCRADGYAVENGEYRIGLRSVSAPVFTAEGDVRYAVSVIGMFRSVQSDAFRTTIGEVRAAAAMISTALGYRKQEEKL